MLRRRRSPDAAATRRSTAFRRLSLVLVTLAALPLAAPSAMAAVPLPLRKPPTPVVVLPDAKPDILPTVAHVPVRKPAVQPAVAHVPVPKPAVQPVAAHVPLPKPQGSAASVLTPGVRQAVFTPRPLAPAEERQRWTCVRFVQEVAPVSLRGNAWQWWQAAAGRYERGQTPVPGSVLVLKKTSHLRYGHVAVVTRIVDSRTIEVDHANWGWSRETRGRIDRGMRVVDVSPANDWSQTRFWYEPGDTLGRRVYPTYGFIQPTKVSGGRA